MGKTSLTEIVNKNTVNIDIVSTYDVLTMINNEDKKIAFAVEKCIPDITQAVDIIVKNFIQGGRLFYVGAGTSGRLGVLDASECPPTFNTSSGMVQGIIAGGDRALREAIEGAEDSEELALKDYEKYDICNNDTVVAISASGNAKYVTTFLKIAKMKKCNTIAISSNKNAAMKEFADCFIFTDTGEEAICGSTRMKAGTAQKMVLNMLSTAAMVKIGKTYHNLMIDVNPTNVKLKRRAVTIVSEIAGCNSAEAERVLNENGYKIKHAILYIMYGLSFKEADSLLVRHNGVIRKVFEELDKK